MKSKFIFRIVAFVLVVLTLFSTLVSCKKDEETEAEDTDTVSTESISTEDGPANDVFEIPEELDFGKQEVKILARKGSLDGIYEFEAENMGSDAVQNAIYTRNLHLQKYLGVTLKFEYELAGAGAIDVWRKKVEAAYMGGMPYDILAADTQCMSRCVLGGYLKDLGTIDEASNYLSYEKVWWNQSLFEAITIGNTNYLLTGDASTLFIQKTQCINFSENYIESLHLDDPYELVANNQWTIEKFISMCKDASTYVDVDENQTVSLADKVPVAGVSWYYAALLHGCNILMSRKDVNGNLVEGEYAMPHTDDLVGKLATINYLCISDNDEIQPITAFKEQRILFHLGNIGDGKKFSGVSFNYGCVPLPKYDEAQENYMCKPETNSTMFGIMANVDPSRYAMVTATLETYAYYGSQYTTKVIFDEVMANRTSASPEMTEMLYLIRDSIYYDFCQVFSTPEFAMASGFQQYITTNYASSTGDIVPWGNLINSSRYRAFKTAIENMNITYSMLAS